MSKAILGGYFLAGLVIAAGAALLLPAPGYMDAEYYYAVALRLAAGDGFSEPFLWNYLNNPVSLPHPAHSYWMPFPTLLAAAGMLLSGSSSFTAARLGFILFSALLPPVTVLLCWRLCGRKDASLLAGGLALLPGYYLIYTTNTETFTPYMLFGGLFLIVSLSLPGCLERRSGWLPWIFILGVLAGLQHQTRADGILWLPAALAVAVRAGMGIDLKHLRSSRLLFLAGSCLCVIVGYLIVMGLWYMRNNLVFDRLLPPGGERTLWLTDYDQTFIYPAEKLTFERWLAQGWRQILQVRLDALAANLKTALAVQGSVFLWPLSFLGFWELRRTWQVRYAAYLWLTVLGVMSLVFPFAGARGGYLHSGAGLQLLIWALAALGITRFVQLGVRLRGWNGAQALRVFGAGLVLIAAALSFGLFYLRVLGSNVDAESWRRNQVNYAAVEGALIQNGISDEDIVLVKNPPGYYLATGRPAIVIPDGNVHTMLEAARRYSAGYLILETDHVSGLDWLYTWPGNRPGLEYLGAVREIHLYRIDLE